LLAPYLLVCGVFCLPSLFSINTRFAASIDLSDYIFDFTTAVFTFYSTGQLPRRIPNEFSWPACSLMEIYGFIDSDLGASSFVSVFPE
jgi:hypothetical protein